MKQAVPWWAKVAAKILISRLNLRNYQFWKKFGIFVNGPMENPEYAINVFEKHYRYYHRKSFTCLELGCGDSLASALIARKHGAERVYLVDVGDFVDRNIMMYESLALKLDMDIDFYSVESYLERCYASYLTHGLKSLKTIPDNSVDFIFSQAVLEHVRKGEFRQTLDELRRILKYGGKMSHSVDLKDHLGGKLNNLRFSESWWEDDRIANSGFYTNRLRYSEMLKLFEDSGFEYECVDIKRFEKIPTPRKMMDESFSRFSDDDLRVSSFHVVMQ